MGVNKYLIGIWLLLYRTGWSCCGNESDSAPWLDSVLGKSKEGVVGAQFEGQNNTILRARSGENVTLDCVVFLRQDTTVSWLRLPRPSAPPSSLPELLTVGEATYSQSARISSSFLYPNNWRLALAHLKPHDGGPYLCQLAAHPPLALVTHLVVEQPPLHIVRDNPAVSDKYFNPGSTIRLECVARREVVPDDGELLWAKDGELIDFNRRGVSLGHRMTGQVLESHLAIPGCTLQDSGNYTCSLPEPRTEEGEDTITVHVITGDRLAVQGGGGFSQKHSRFSLLATFLPCLLLAFGERSNLRN